MMINPSAVIFKELLKNGTHKAGDGVTNPLTYYSYSVNSELKQFTINISADVDNFSGSTVFGKTLSRNQTLGYFVEEFKNELLSLLLVEKEHYHINKDKYTITFKESGYRKLLTKKDFPELLKIVTLIFSLRHNKPHEVAAIVFGIMVNKNSCFRIIPSSTDNNVHELYADCGSSESLSQELRDAFRTAAVDLLNEPDTNKVKIPVKEDQLPDQLNINNKLSASFNKYIVLSKYMFDLLIRESREIKNKIPVPEIEETSAKPKLNFADCDAKVEEISIVRANETKKNFKIETQKRRSLALSVQLNVTDENRDVWQHAITTGLAADMEGILPEDKVVTLDNKYEICQKLEEFFLNREKINNIKMINLLFLGLLDLKDDINVHKHGKYDSVMFKNNTDSWQKLVKNIRDRAFELLTEEIEGKDDLTAIKILKKYSEENIFKLHRSNAFFMKIGKTKTVKKIDLLIEQRQNSYIEKGKAIAPI